MASQTSSSEAMDAYFTKRTDPWGYETSALELERYALQTAILDEVRGTQLFASALEIGCAEGLYTEALADRCASLLALDLSTIALERARNRRLWPESLRFEPFDLRCDRIPGQFDLIVVAGVLEYLKKRGSLVVVREKLASALRPNGFLLVVTTRANSVVEEACWAKLVIRGKEINSFIARDPRLHTVTQVLLNHFALTLLCKTVP